jgi:hypothetical protein
LIQNAELKAFIKEKDLQIEELSDYKDRYEEIKIDRGENYTIAVRQREAEVEKQKKMRD